MAKIENGLKFYEAKINEFGLIYLLRNKATGNKYMMKERLLANEEAFKREIQKALN